MVFSVSTMRLCKLKTITLMVLIIVSIMMLQNLNNKLFFMIGSLKMLDTQQIIRNIWPFSDYLMDFNS